MEKKQNSGTNKNRVNELAKSFEDLIVWQKAHEFVLSVYRVTKDFPKEEIFGLVSQFRRASVSVPANIAEGFGKKSKLDKLRYLNISQGSLEECRYYVLLSKDLGYLKVSSEDMLNQVVDVSKLLTGYIKAIHAGLNKEENRSR
uniref:S23 ribosomal protein n=1 Tax=Chlorobium phaeobacteroides (strain BS1) TaxID=331678 RepID=B3ELY3_CHLPB